MSETFVKCPCQFCNNPIEFEAANTGQLVSCPHCKMETRLFVPPPISSKDTSSKGSILDYSIQTNTGIISGDDGRRYAFSGAEWKDSSKLPGKGDKVDFVNSGTTATAIYLCEAQAGTHKCDKFIAGLLALFLGVLGIHKFYMGRKQSGIIYLVITIATCGYGMIFTWIAGLVECILYLTASQADFESKYVNSKSKFF